jgi:hypothetical protein
VPRLSQTSRISHLESRILYIYIYIYTINEHTFQSFRPENNNKSSSKLYLKSQAADGHKGNKSALRHEYMSMSMFTAALVTTSTSKFNYLYPTIPHYLIPPSKNCSYCVLNYRLVVTFFDGKAYSYSTGTYVMRSEEPMM